MNDRSYAGDVSPEEAWARLQSDPDCVLIDVRTDAEWNFVGLPDLSGIGKETHCISWVRFPGGVPNDSFLEEVKRAGVAPDQTVLCLCRSGQRSIAAAVALTENGYGQAFNVLEGFEGDKDAENHRGTKGGWKVRGLPWAQG
jgi:rhodanese-related sulfurtransferase